MTEMEVLSDIYGDCIKIIAENEFNMQFLPFIGDENDKAFLLVDMNFVLPPDYPTSPLIFKVLHQKGLDEDSLQTFCHDLKEE